jgi:hypothetical protein
MQVAECLGVLATMHADKVIPALLQLLERANKPQQTATDPLARWTVAASLKVYMVHSACYYHCVMHACISVSLVIRCSTVIASIPTVDTCECLSRPQL